MIQCPSWINSALFQNSLQNYFKDDKLEFNTFSIKPALAAGENYTSDLYRASVDYTTGDNVREKMSLIVKLVPDTGFKSDMAGEMLIFEKEIRIYQNILPRINKKLGDPKTLSPQCLFAEIKPHTVIIMEDLSQLGYLCANRQAGLDLKHSMMVMEYLAKLHAGSLFVAREYPNEFTFYDFGIFNDEHGKDFVDDWITNSFKGLIAATKKWVGYEKYTLKLEKLLPVVVQRGIAKSKMAPGGFTVLCHGDTWVNNFLFKYNDGVPVQMKFVDFQMAIYSSPAIDLLYFFFTSPTEDVRINHMDQLLRHYHSHLIKTVLSLNGKPEDLKIPNYQEFLKDFDNRGFFGVVAAVVIMSIIRAPKKDGASIEAVIAGEPNMLEFMFNTTQYKTAMADMLPFFDNRGWLD